MENYNKNFNVSNDDFQSKKKKILRIGIIVCIVLIIVLVLLVIYYKDLDAKTFKLFIDGTQASGVSDDFYISDEQGNIYVKAKELASYIGWTYQNGEYLSFTEDSNSGYVQNDYEVASFVVDSKIVKKYIVVSDAEEEEEEEIDEEDESQITVNSEDGTLETMELDLPVIMYNEQIYLPFSCLDDICNCYVGYSSNRMNIYESNYLLQLAQQNAASFGYSAVSGVYENIRALAYGMMIVQQSNGNFGVVSLFDQSAETIIGFKYKDIIFRQNVKEFFITATTGEVGIIDVDGNVVITPGDYDNISILDDSLGLYLIEKSNKYGIINREGDTIVYADYDSIGLSEEAQYVFEKDTNQNTYLIYDSTIVVEEDGKYGFYSLSGTNTLRANYDGIGYISDSDAADYEATLNSKSNSSESEEEASTEEGNSVLTINLEFELDDGSIAQSKGIVVKQTGITGETLYGVYDALNEKLVIPCACTKIYSITKNGTTTYYLEYNGESFEYTSYAKSHPNDSLYTIISSGANATITSTDEESDENIVDYDDTSENENALIENEIISSDENALYEEEE